MGDPKRLAHGLVQRDLVLRDGRSPAALLAGAHLVESRINSLEILPGIAVDEVGEAATVPVDVGRSFDDTLRPVGLEPLLSFAEELERRDAAIAGALAEVERLRADVEELRTHAASVSGFLASLPAVAGQHDADAQAAAESHERAAATLREAESELERAGNDIDDQVLAQDLAP